MGKCTVVFATIVTFILGFLLTTSWEVTKFERTLSSFYYDDYNDDTLLSLAEREDMKREKKKKLHDFLYHNKVYDVASEIQAPRLHKWWQLTIVSRILASSPLGDFLVRRLLIKNGILDLVEFANLIQNENELGKEYGMGEPIIRLSREQYEWHQMQATIMKKDNTRNSHYVKSNIQLSHKESSPCNNQANDDVMNDSCDLHDTDDFQYDEMSKHNNHKYNSVRDFHRVYSQNDNNITPTIVLKRLLRFIQETDKDLRCIEKIDDVETSLMVAAKESEERFKNGTSLGIWDGVPVFIKAQSAIKGLNPSFGKQPSILEKNSIMTRIQINDDDDVLVQRFRKAGALVIGNTVMHELGVQNTGYNPWFHGPTNPCDTKRFAGGSSGGSAVVVATGMVPVAMGWDGGGSIRVPASWSGTVGLATSYSRTPSSSMVNTNVVQVLSGGPLSATVQDAADTYLLLSQPLTKDENRDNHLYHVLYGNDGPPPPHLHPRWYDNLYQNDNNKNDNNKPIRVGILQKWVSHRLSPSSSSSGVTGTDDAVYTNFQECIHRLERQLNQKTKNDFYTTVSIHIPHLQKQALAHAMIITSAFTFTSLHELYKSTNSRLKGEDYRLQPATEIQIKLGSQIMALELQACQRIRAFAISLWRNVLLKGDVDVILTPTTPMTALERPAGSDKLGFTDSDMFVKIMRYLWPTNLLGLPSIAIPIGVDSAGLPISIQVICLHWHEADCLSVAADIEALFVNECPKPPSKYYIDLLAP